MKSLRRLWRLLPRPWRLKAYGVLKSLVYLSAPLRVGHGWRRGNPGGDPVTVLGLHSAVLGLGEAARIVSTALERTGRQVRRTDISRLVGHAAEFPVTEDPVLNAGVVVSQINPPELMWTLAMTGAEHLKGRRHIGYWSWELPEAPRSWRAAFAYVDEVWALSEFNAEALRSIAPPHVPIKAVGLPVYMFPRLEPDRAAFGVAGEAPVVLAGFDLKSTAARKNPWAALAAYKLAVPEPDGSARLLLKLSGPEADLPALEALRREAAARSDIILLDAHLDDVAMRRLMASADICLSLHRSEGFGLFPAEAMWLGKPVVATGWSGNMDFMDEESAGLVRYTIVDAPADAGFYVGGRWADPDIGHAAALLSRLIRDPAHRAEMGRRALAKAQTVFSEQRWLAAVGPSLARRG